MSYGLALEWSPNHGSVSHGELSQTTSWQNAALRDVEGVHDGDDEVSPRACALHVLQKLACYQLVHIPAEVRGMQGDLALEVVEEKHRCRCRGHSIYREVCWGESCRVEEGKEAFFRRVGESEYGTSQVNTRLEMRSDAPPFPDVRSQPHAPQ